MSQIIPIYIPTFISDQNYNPSRVLPHVYFYNGLIDCEEYWIESGSLTEAGVTYAQTKFPYFDNYNVVTGSFPTANSDSLLFNNENAVYGEIPTSSLYTNYWDTYISLLYNPKTRLLTCEAIIPLADYIKMELNDVVNFRGNYYHLRAINDYSLKTGECTLQLLGPIIQDTLSDLQPPPEPPTPPVSGAFAEISWSFTETNGANGDFKIYRNGSPVVTATSTTSGNLRVSGSDAIAPELSPVSWSAGVTSSLNTNGGATISSSTTTNTTLTGSFTAQTGSIYYITGSVTFNATSSVTCCAPTNVSASVNGGNLDIYFNTGSASCDACLATRTELSLDSVTWDTPISTSCISPNVITLPTSSVYIRMYQICVTGSATSSFSNTYYFNSGSSVYEFTGCGRGDNVTESCNDASNNRTFYSDCTSGTFGVGCYVYVDTFPNPLTGYSNVFMNGANWDISAVTGIVTAYSSPQC